MGALVREVYVYKSVLPADLKLSDMFFQDLTAEKINAIIFGSTLCVKNLFERLGNRIISDRLRDLLNSRVTKVAIGPVTAGALAGLGVKVDVVPDRHLFEEALDALALLETGLMIDDRIRK